MGDDQSNDPFLVVAIDVSRHDGEEINRGELADRFTAALSGQGFSVSAVRPNRGWESLSGAPETRRPDSSIAAFEVVSGIAFVLLAALSGVVGNRADHAAVTLAKSSRKRLGRKAPPLTRETALARARGAVAACWPADIHPYLLDRLEVMREDEKPDGAWSFEFLYRHEVRWDEARRGYVSDYGPFAYRAVVLPIKSDAVVGTEVTRVVLGAA